MLLNFTLASPLHQAKVTVKLAKNLLFITRILQNKQEREMEQQFCVLCRALLTNRSRNFLKSQ
jgi:uncharacterized protein with von Willebrand factor type A (vWA) domain